MKKYFFVFSVFLVFFACLPKQPQIKTTLPSEQKMQANDEYAVLEQSKNISNKDKEAPAQTIYTSKSQKKENEQDAFSLPQKTQTLKKTDKEEPFKEAHSIKNEKGFTPEYTKENEIIFPIDPINNPSENIANQEQKKAPYTAKPQDFNAVQNTADPPGGPAAQNYKQEPLHYKLKPYYGIIAELFLLSLLFVLFFTLSQKIYKKIREKAEEHKTFFAKYPNLKNIIIWVSLLLFLVLALFVIQFIFNDGYFKNIKQYKEIMAVLISFIIAFIINYTLNFIKNFYFKNTPYEKYFKALKAAVIAGFLLFIAAFFFSNHPKLIITFASIAVLAVTYIFSSTVLDFFAVLWLKNNDMIKEGDWIEMEKRNIDGVVTEITITMVKVRHWDKTVYSVPAYGMLSDSFKNWSHILEKQNRRIKRSVNINFNSIFIIDDNFLNNLPEYIDKKYFQNVKLQTNLQAFVHYCSATVKELPVFYPDDIFMIRQLQPSAKGLPLELYFFIKTHSWEDYEVKQADIFDYILTLMPLFGLRMHQNLTGPDLKSL